MQYQMKIERLLVVQPAPPPGGQPENDEIGILFHPDQPPTSIERRLLSIEVQLAELQEEVEWINADMRRLQHSAAMIRREMLSGARRHRRRHA